MSELPTPISDQDKLLSNIAIGTPDIEDLIPNSRQEIYLKYIALNGIHELPVSISQGGTGGTTSEEARQNLGINLPLPINNGGTGATTVIGARQNLEVMKATTLYSNNSGTSGTITLNDDIANYSYIDVTFKADNGFFSTQSVYEPSGKSMYLFASSAYKNTSTVMTFSSVITFSGTSVTWNIDNDSFFAVNTSDTHTFRFERGLYIRKIVGYSY